MSSHTSLNMPQVKWRCRRGMLELDLLLNNFVEIEYNNLGEEDVESFSILLDYPDQVLLDLLLGKKESSDVLISDLVTRIQRTCYHEYNYVKPV